MKLSVFLVAIALVASSYAQDYFNDLSCKAFPRQIQLVGSVIQSVSLGVVKTGNEVKESCLVRAEPDMMGTSEHFACPVYIGEVSKIQIPLVVELKKGCPKIGTTISGYLMKDNKGRFVLQ